MQDQVAQVTSSLLQFPEVTVQALGEDEITLDSVLRGKFAAGRNGLAWLACGPQLEVVNSVTGERLSAYRFSGVTEQPPTVLAVKEFSWQKRTGLLVGIEETEGSVLCLYDLGISRVVKAVILPGRVTAIEPIINHGGATASTQHLHQSLRWFFGVAAVVTDVGHVLLVDLCLDDLSCSHDELEAYDLEVMSGIPAEIPQIREDVTRQRRHLCLQLLNPSGTTVSTLCYIGRTNQLAVGFSDGYLSLWNMKTLKREYHCILEGGRVPIYAVAFQEPENDPRNCCYLWAVQSTQESEGDLVSLHLLQLAFGDRKCLASGQILYEGLEYCEERYSLDLTGGVFSLRNQTSNTRLLGCQTVERFRSHGERDDSLNDAVSPDTSVSVFSWQVNVYGQGKPSTYLAVFDINRWYHAQMPDSLRPGEFLHNCSYFTLWSLDAVVSMTSPHYILDILVHERSLSRGVPPSYPPPEQFFSPSTYNFDATCLVNSGVVHVAFTGLQKETLHFLKKSGPFLSEAVPDGYNRCLVSGLLSPRLADVQPSSMSQEEQLQAVLSAAVGTSSLGLLTGCIKQWTAEEQPRSAANLRFILEWTWNKVTTTKEELDRLCASLFDGSCNFIDLQTLQSLQHCQLLLGNLCSVLNCFLTEAHELTKKGFIDLTNKKVVTCLIFQYAQVVLWFCRSGLLPEGSDMAADMQLSRPTYNYHSLHNYYVGRRQKLERLSRGKWNFDCLMIDGMLAQFRDQIGKLWSRDEGGTGKYPPANLHALLDIYLLENVEDTMKHAITIYLLLDIMYSIPNKTGTAVESFPTAFAMPWGLVKLVQGFWLLDHNDHKNSLDAILHPATSRTMLTWHHTRIIQSLMCQGEHRQALRYIQMMKPPMTSSSEVTLHLTVLLCNRSIVEALNLLRLHSNKLNVKDLLRHMYETCQEMGLMEDLLKLPFTDTEQECLENFLQTSGVKNQEFLLVHHLQRANYISALQLNQSLKVNLMNDREPSFRERADARNSILDQYGKVLPRVQMRLAAERTKPYSLPSSVLREVSRPRPLSTVVKQIAKGNIVSKATFINNVLTKIREVSSANEQEADFSIYKSLNNDESMILPDAFVGTPITKASQRISRLLNSVVHPVPQFSPELASYRQTPVKANSLQITSSPLQSNIRKSGSIKNILKATEFGLLETPLIVRRAKVLATCGDTSGFAVFTPQSILRSSLRTTPLGSPCPSPGRSVTPPLRSKETKISFMEENVGAKWTGVTVGDCKTKLLLLDSPVQKSLNVTRSAWTNGTEKVSSFASGSHMGLHLEVDECSVTAIENNLSKMEASKETSNVSARSDQTTLEYHDAHDTEDFEDVAFVASNAPDPVSDKPTECHNWQGQDEMAENEQLEYQQKDDLQLNVSQLQYSQCHEEDLESDAEEHPELQEQENFEEIVGDEQLEFQEQKSLSNKDPSVSQIVEHSPCHVEDSETATEEPSKLQLQLEKYDEMAENEQLEFQQQKIFPLDHNVSQIVEHSPCHVEDSETATEESSKLQLPLEKYDEMAENEQLGFQQQKIFPLDHNVSQIVQIPQGRFDDLWSIPTEEPSILQMQEEKDKEMAENEQLEIEQKTFLPLEVHNELQETDVEYLIVPENGVALLDDISTEQDICAPAYLLPDIDGESFDRESEEKALSVKSSTYTSESTVADAESVISIHDSEDFASIYSENRLEESNHEDPVEDNTIDAKVIEKRGLEKETIPPTTLQSDSRNSVETQEIHVFEKDGELEIQLEETGVISYGEFNSPGTGKVPCVFESIEEHFTSELDDGKDTAECEMIETDGEHFVAQNNFSLVLEGEEEAEKELAILATPEKAASTTKNYVEYDEQDDIRNTLSFVASANEPNVIEALPSVAETNIELLAYVSEQSTLEARTYISESIKESVTENVQNIYKDRSKDIALEVMEQSVCETEPQTGTNITSCNSSRTPLKTVVGSNEKDVHFSPVDDWLTSVKHSGAQSIKDLSIHSTEVEQLSPKEYKQELVALSTQKRSSRRTKDLSLDSDEISTDKQASQILTPRRRGSRKDKVSTTEASENRHSLIAVEQEASVLRSGLRRAKSTVSDRPEVLNIENLPLKNIKMLSTPKRITRSITNLTEEQESSQLVSDQKLQMPVTPRRNAKISKAVLVELSEHIPSKPENEHSDHEQQLPLVLTKGAKGDGSSMSEGFESLGSDSSKLMSHQEVLELPSTPRRSSRRSILSASEVADTSHKSPIDERQPKEKEQIPQTQKISKRIKTGKTDIHNDVKNTSKQTLEEPSEATDNQNNSETRTINLNESHLHSVTEESTEVKSSPHVAREERLDTAGLALTDAPSSDEKLQNARKSNIFRDEELASNERMQESTEVLQTERDSIGVAPEHESLSRKTQQPSSVEKEKTVFPSILQSSSEERESNHLVGPHVPIASDHKMLSKKLKNEVDLSGNMGSNRQLPSEQPHAIPVTPKRGARGRNKSVVEHSEPAELNVSMSLLTPAKHQFPLTPRRSSRRGTSNLLDVMDSNPQEGSGLKEQDKMLNSSSRRPKRGKTSQTSNEEEGVRHTSEGTSEDSSSELVSRRTPRGRKKENIDNRIRKSQLPSVSEESTVEERLPSPETRERLHGADSVLTRSLRLHGKKTNRDTEGTSKSSSEEETRVDSSKELNNKQKHGSRMTKIHDKQKRKGQPASVAKESTDEKSSETPENKERLQGKDSVLTVAPRLHRKEETVVEHNSTRTRSSNLSVPPYVTVDVNEHFVFSPPSTKRKNQKAGKTRHPELLFNLESDVSAQFVYSPPAMRTRRKDQSSISEIVKERDLLIQENTQTTEEPIVKKRGRPSKPKTKDSRSSKVPWSPPPVEAKLISPFPSPAIEATSNTKTSSDEATEKMTLRRNRKRLLSSFTKPVTRRKMR